MSAPLSPHETRILAAIQDGAERDLDAIARAAGLEVAQARSAVESLKLRGHVAETGRKESRVATLAEAGRRFLESGLPERVILERVQSEKTIAEAQDLPGHEKKTVGAAFGWLKQKGHIEVSGPKVKAKVARLPELEEVWGAFQRLEGGAVDWSSLPESFRTRYEPKKRGGGDSVVDLKESVSISYRVTESGRGVSGSGTSGEAPAALTTDMLRTGKWREVLGSTGFRPYNVGEPPATVVGRRDPYREFLDSVKRTLLGLGFEEMAGSLVETEFWDMDALFLPQFHPAREIHDVYFVDDGEGGYAKQRDPSADEAKAIEAVAREHEGKGVARSRGWGYSFDRERTKRLVLRSQGTVLSARWLARRDLKNPGKYFAMARCFRYDTVDATHAPDFFQVEGIVVSEKTSFRHLLGLLKLFALEVARAPEVKFVPAYFPFTEPSVEVHMKHPTLGWMELGGAGIFRPEVTLPHGVTAPVIAWGLGLDRMAMVALGIKDIRELFTNNVPNGLAAVRERVPR